MPIEGLTPQHNKVYDFLLGGGFTSPEKLQDADKITIAVKLPKGVVANTLLDLEKKGWVKRIARGKSAGYFVTKTPGAAEKVKGDGDFSADDFF